MKINQRKHEVQVVINHHEFIAYSSRYALELLLDGDETGVSRAILLFQNTRPEGLHALAQIHQLVGVADRDKFVVVKIRLGLVMGGELINERGNVRERLLPHFDNVSRSTKMYSYIE